MAFFETGIIWFFIYSVIGWIYETIFCSIRERRFVYRGFLIGPYCPIYGFGALLVIFTLGKIENVIVLFFASAILTCSLEYATSWLMEKLFHARWWDYSNKKFNINGRVYLLGAIVFGTFSVLLIKFLHPIVSSYTVRLSLETISIMAWLIFAVMLTDTVFTVTKFSEFDHIMHIASTHLNEMVSSIKQFYKKANDSYQGKLYKINSQIRRMVISYHMLRSTRYNETVKKLREALEKKDDDDNHS